MTFSLKPQSYRESDLSGLSELLVQLKNVSLSIESLDKIRYFLISALNSAYANPEQAEAPVHQLEALLQSIDHGPEAFMSTLRRLISIEQSMAGLGSLGNLFTKIGTAIAKVADKVKPKLQPLLQKGKEVIAAAKPLISQLQQQPVADQYLPQQASQTIPYQTTNPTSPGVEKPNRTLLYVGLGVGGLLLLGGVLYLATRQRQVSGVDGALAELPVETTQTTKSPN